MAVSSESLFIKISKTKTHPTPPVIGKQRGEEEGECFQRSAAWTNRGEPLTRGFAGGANGELLFWGNRTGAPLLGVASFLAVEECECSSPAWLGWPGWREGRYAVVWWRRSWRMLKREGRRGRIADAQNNATAAVSDGRRKRSSVRQNYSTDQNDTTCTSTSTKSSLQTHNVTVQLLRLDVTYILLDMDLHDSIAVFAAGLCFSSSW